MGPWNGMGKAWIQGLLEHGKEICSSFKSNEVIKIKSNRKSKNKSEKFSKKRKFQNPGCHKPTPLKKISSSRFGFSGPSQAYCPLETCCYSDFLFTAYCSHGSIQYI